MLSQLEPDLDAVMTSRQRTTLLDELATVSKDSRRPDLADLAAQLRGCW